MRVEVTQGLCFNCRRESEFQTPAGTDLATCCCQVCGEFKITETARKVENIIPEDKRWMMSSWIREQNEANQIPEISRSYKITIFDNISESLVHIKLEKSLILFSKYSKHPGAPVQFQLRVDYPLFWAENERAAKWLFLELVDQGFLRQWSKEQQVASGVITSTGWKAIYEMMRTSSNSHQVFVAMWFDDSMDEAYINGIKKAVEECGYDPLRIDKKEHINKIDDEIIAGIRRSRFLIADTTGQRQGVYFEAGFAMGLDIPVVWCCEENAVEENHFDTRQYSHIVWKSPDDLAVKLENKIKALDL